MILGKKDLRSAKAVVYCYKQPGAAFWIPRICGGLLSRPGRRFDCKI